MSKQPINNAHEQENKSDWTTPVYRSILISRLQVNLSRLATCSMLLNCCTW